jgi:hypothetical protein
LTEKLTKVEIVDIFLNKYGEAEPISIFRPNRPWILWQKYNMKIAIKTEGKTFFKIENVGRLYCYVSIISSRNWAYKSLILVARAAIKTTVMAD